MNFPRNIFDERHSLGARGDGGSNRDVGRSGTERKRRKLPRLKGKGV